MYKEFPKEFEQDQIATSIKSDLTNAFEQSIVPFISFLTISYLETGVKTHEFTAVLNPEQTSPGSVQEVVIRIEIDDNFS